MKNPFQNIKRQLIIYGLPNSLRHTVSVGLDFVKWICKAKQHDKYNNFCALLQPISHCGRFLQFNIGTVLWRIQSSVTMLYVDKHTRNFVKKLEGFSEGAKFPSTYKVEKFSAKLKAYLKLKKKVVLMLFSGLCSYFIANL